LYKIVKDNQKITNLIDNCYYEHAPFYQFMLLHDHKNYNLPTLFILQIGLAF